jgi:hypothetical protein
MEEMNVDFLELCHLANKRNILSNRKMSAVGRRLYWSRAISIVKKLNKDPLGYKPNVRARFTLNTVKKWMKMGIMRLRANELKAEADLAQSQYETMELTFSTKKRVAQLRKKLNARVAYDACNGVYIISHNHENDRFGREEIRKYAQKYEAHKAVEIMLGT